RKHQPTRAADQQLLSLPDQGDAMRRPSTIALGFACLALLAGGNRVDAQFNIGLYKDGQLIDTFGGPAANGTNAAPKMLGGRIPGTLSSRAAVAPAISPETQARNQVFAESARLSIQIQEVVREMRGPPGHSAKPKQHRDQLAA